MQRHLSQINPACGRQGCQTHAAIEQQPSRLGPASGDAPSQLDLGRLGLRSQWRELLYLCVQPLYFESHLARRRFIQVLDVRILDGNLGKLHGPWLAVRPGCGGRLGFGCGLGLGQPILIHPAPCPVTRNTSRWPHQLCHAHRDRLFGRVDYRVLDMELLQLQHMILAFEPYRRAKGC